MSADNISLAMISHGTDGSDGLERGIHLRVGVDRRKGIPASGFRIYRRYSYGNDKGEAVINFASSSPSVALPCGVKFSVGSESYSATLSSESIKSINTLMITIDGIQKQYVKLEGKYRIKFSTPVNKLKLDCFFNDGGDAEISVLYNGKIVEEQQYKDLNHQVYLTLKANKADELFINGIQRFYLGEIGFYTLEDDKKGWTGPINDKYGLGLPLNTTPEALFEIAKKSGELPAGIAPTLREFLRFIAGKDPDWLLSLLRLPKKQRAGFDEKEFKELKELMTDVMSDKQGLPADDFKYKDCEDNVDGSGISSSMSISPLSILLMSSLDPYIARVLGFYWNDATALPGKFYDYKVEADYPDGMLFNLGKYTDFSGFDGADSSIFNIGDYIFETGSNPYISADNAQSILCKGGIGARLGDGVIIRFTKTVKELQLYVKHGVKALKVEGFSYGKLVVSSVLNKTEGIVCLHSKVSLDYIKISEGVLIKPPPGKFTRPGDILRPEIDIKNIDINGQKRPVTEIERLLRSRITIFKIATSPDYLGFDTSSFLVKGVSIGTKALPEVPVGLSASVLKGLAGKGPSGKNMDRHYYINLNWNMPKQDENVVAYSVRRQTPSGAVEDATSNGLHFAVADKDDSSLTYFQDIRIQGGKYVYFVQAVDIWGRRSTYSPGVEALCERFLPPSPYLLEARLLEPGDGSLNDMELNEIKTQNNLNGITNEALYKSVLKVTYNWDEALDSQGIDVHSFNFYFQPGWQNVLMGRVTGTVLSSSNLGSRVTMYTDLVMDDAGDSGFLNGESLRTEDGDYTIINSMKNSRNEIVIEVELSGPYGKGYVTAASGTFAIISSEDRNDRYEVVFAIPQDVLEVEVGEKVTIGGLEYPVISKSYTEDALGGSVVLELQKLYPYRDSYFTIPMKPGLPVARDYSISSNWDMMLASKQNTGWGIKTVYFFNPPFKAGLEEKIIYAQIGASSVNSNGEGIVSKALPILSVYRDKPAPAEIMDAANQYATLPDFYGKCSFGLRWMRDNSSKYIIYRALDDAVFLEDKKNRRLKLPFTDGTGIFNETEIDSFIEGIGVVNDLGLSPSDARIVIDAIKTKVIKAPVIDYYVLFEETWANVLLKALANLPGNETAFTRLNEKEISPSDEKYANRKAFWELDSLQLNMGCMLYIDSSIDGGADNNYFYRIRTVNESGVMGDFSTASYPIRLFKPVVTGTPDITSVKSGDREAVITFRTLSDKTVKGYVVYRTDDVEAAKDIRLMTPILQTGKVITVSHPGESYTDTGLLPDKLYYYRIVALGEAEFNNNYVKIYSKPSAAVAVKVFEDQRPDAPVWNPPAKINGGTELELSWIHGDNTLKCLVQRRECVQGMADSEGFLTLGSWLAPGVYNLCDRNREAGKIYDYRIRVIDASGRQNKYFNLLRGV